MHSQSLVLSKLCQIFKAFAKPGLQNASHSIVFLSIGNMLFPGIALGIEQKTHNLSGWSSEFLEPRNLPEPLLGTLLGTSEPSGTFTRNPSWNLGTCRNLYSEPFLEARNLPEPLLGTLLGTSEPCNLLEPLLGTFCLEPWKTCRNLYLKILLGTSEPLSEP